MIPSARNEQTIGILSRLKQKGPPPGGQLPEDGMSLDMTLPEGEAEGGQADILQPTYLGKKGKEKRRVGPGPFPGGPV